MSKPKRSKVLSGLPERLLSEPFEDAVVHKLRDGEVLFRAGDVGDGCYVFERPMMAWPRRHFSVSNKSGIAQYR
jgi:hypothetical protein